jgi:hypothetical protein
MTRCTNGLGSGSEEAAGFHLGNEIDALVESSICLTKYFEDYP